MQKVKTGRGRKDCRGLNQCSSLGSLPPPLLSLLLSPFYFFLSVSNDSQRKEKASSLSSVEPNISFLLERQEGNTEQHSRTHTRTHTQRKFLTSGFFFFFFAAKKIRSSTSMPCTEMSRDLHVMLGGGPKQIDHLLLLHATLAAP